MSSVAEIVAGLGRIAPWGKAAAWDPVGLQLGDPAAQVRRLGVCHDVTGAVIDAATEEGVDMLVAYHPLLFRPVTRLVAGSDVAGRAYRLVASSIALAVVHTAFDVAPGGAADSLAAALGLVDVAAFGPAWPRDAVRVVTFVPPDRVDDVEAAASTAGAGVIGDYTGCSFRTEGVGTFVAGASADPAYGTPGAANAEPEIRIELVAPASSKDAVVAAIVQAHPYEEPAYDVYEVAANAGFVGRAGVVDATDLAGFADRVAEVLGGVLRVAGDPTTPIRRVAAVPGSGGSLIGAAGSVDVVVTGDVTHHTAREALSRGVAVVDPGHAAGERPGLRTLYAAASTLAGDVVDLTGVDADPWEAQWRS